MKELIDDPDVLAAASARVGTVLCGKYRLDAILGVGGMATVYAATHRNHARLAVKVLHPELCAQPRVRKRFLREAHAVNSVNHRNVLKIVDDDVTDDGAAFLVMDRLDGALVEELADRNGGRLGIHPAVAVVDQLLDVLAAAHAAKIVHRDVKPANLFVTWHGDVKVLDFGIARTHDAMATALNLTGAGAILGTPAFMAPEQAVGGMADIDERTDVWAAGATLFALVSGRTVHEGATLAELVMRAALHVGRSLATVAPHAPQAIVEVVDCALAFEKRRRWRTAEEMREALLAAYRLHFGRAPGTNVLASLLDPNARRSTFPPPHAVAPSCIRELAPPRDLAQSDEVLSQRALDEDTILSPPGVFDETLRTLRRPRRGQAGAIGSPPELERATSPAIVAGRSP